MTHRERFNLSQDVRAAGVLLDSGVALVLVPCMGVASRPLASVSEMDRYLRGRSPLLTDDRHWARDARRHPVRVAHMAHRNPVFKDLYTKLSTVR